MLKLLIVTSSSGCTSGAAEIAPLPADKFVDDGTLSGSGTTATGDCLLSSCEAIGVVELFSALSSGINASALSVDV